MRAWTVDADDIRVAEDFDESLLHRTPEIDAFLAPEREDKFIVIGTKGFGKTLLLKAKRILYQRAGQSVCLPSGNLLDKPIGDKIFSREAIAFFAASPLSWSKVWLTAVALAALKQAGETDALKVNARLASLVTDARLHSVIDHFVRLLDFTPSELQRCAADTDGHLVPRLRMLKTPLAIFIDGIDEYFNKHVEAVPINPSVTGELSPDVWYHSQLGLVEVAYQLRRINHRLKLFAAIRKEAYGRLAQRTAMVQQYRGSAVDIAYSPESLREIFVNNVRLLKPDRLVLADRARAHPLEAFLGCTGVVDATTREEEDVFGYICRHTLLRPRDLMTIGDRLLALRPDERRQPQRAMEAVNQAAGEIAHEYLAEIAPYIGQLDLERLFKALPGPVLTRAEIAALCSNGSNDEATPDEDERAFHALYRVGLLGHVQHDIVRGEWRQRFLRPGEATLETGGVLPPATHYLMHPVLFGVIGRLNPGFLMCMHRQNIIGYDRPWKSTAADEPQASSVLLCLLKADVHGFGGLMSAGADGPVRRALADAVGAWSPTGAISELGNGDSVLIACDDPVALVQTARHLMDAVYGAPGQPRLRIALHHGEVFTRDRDGRQCVVGGTALLCAARVEPVVEPGQIWATEEFRAQFVQRPSLWRTVPLQPAGGGERFKVSKPGTTEPEMWVRLYRLES
jgi:class 3 adenylate cyclase